MLTILITDAKLIDADYYHCHQCLCYLFLYCQCCAADANLSYFIYFQADLLLLSSSEPHGLCYIETAELDGSENTPHLTIDSKYLTILHKQQETTSKLLCVVLSCRETNMKVRQSVSVTSELGDPNNLASFDGEI